ncbi:MAG: hypothetical protein IPG34_15490 [Rhodocyclaceae bacterium]|nr:hypothetical protein [Rhodocyclaceae bacterium]
MNIVTSPNSPPLLGRGRRMALAVFALNMVLILLFPPFDYISLARGNIPTFEGFRFLFADNGNRVINRNFLWLELTVVLINFLIAWILLRTVPPGEPRKTNFAQRALMVVVGVNLILIVLFPPFENFAAITKAVLPTFEGFYFVLADNSNRQIVVPILYLEVAVLLINASLLWLFLKSRTDATVSRDRVSDLARTVQSVQRR